MSALGVAVATTAGVMYFVVLADLGYFCCLFRPCRDCRALLEIAAAHQAAHAVAGIAAGLRVKRIELRPAPEAIGAVVWDGWAYPDGQQGDLIAYLAMLRAGQAAHRAHLAHVQRRAQPLPSSCCYLDDLADRAIRDAGEAARHAELAAAAEQLAERLVTVHWELIRQLARRVLEADGRRLDGVAAHQVCRSVTPMPSSADLARKLKTLLTETSTVHEAAHAVIGAAVGFEVTSVTVHLDQVEELGSGGVASLTCPDADLTEHLAMLWAGQVAHLGYLSRQGLLDQPDQPYGELVVTQPDDQDQAVLLQAGAHSVSITGRTNDRDGDLDKIDQAIRDAGEAARHAELAAASKELARRLVDLYWEVISQVAQAIQEADNLRLSGAAVHHLCEKLPEAPETRSRKRRRERLAWVTTLAEIWHEALAKRTARTGRSVNDAIGQFLADEYLTDGLAQLLRGETTAIQIADSRDALLGRRAVELLQDEASTPSRNPDPHGVHDRRRLTNGAPA